MVVCDRGSILGHRHPADILKMADTGLLPRIELTSRRMPSCHACSVGNFNFHHSVPRHHHRATRPLERIYADFFIPGQEAAADTAGAVLVVIDDATRYVWVHVAATRVAAITWFKQFLPKMKRQGSQRVVNVITDNAPEFISAHFQTWLDSQCAQRAQSQRSCRTCYPDFDLYDPSMFGRRGSPGASVALCPSARAVSL